MVRLVIGMMTLCSSIAFSMGGKLPPSGDGTGRMQCAYYDTGSHEEHGSHSNLEECQRKHNGKCEERCFTYSTTCEVVGERFEYIQDHSGNYKREVISSTYTGTDRDEYRARSEARRSCEHAYPRNDNCSVKRCDEDARRR